MCLRKGGVFKYHSLEVVGRLQDLKMVVSHAHLNKLSHNLMCDEKIDGKTTYLNITLGAKGDICHFNQAIPLNRVRSKDDGPESFVMVTQPIRRPQESSKRKSNMVFETFVLKQTKCRFINCHQDL